VVIAMAGAAVALVSGLADAPAGAWGGDLIMIAATLVMALYNVWSRPFIVRSSPLAYVTAGMGFGAACLVVVAAWSDGYASVAGFHGPQWVAVVYLGVFGGAAAFFLWVFALERTTPTRTAITMTINPVFASAVGALTLGEPIGINLVVGLLAVFAGIWIATSGPAAKKRDSLAA
jgi:drug/metabolite transporter (DMT)-like permease